MNDNYMSGFGNSFETEALEGALPIGQNTPQQVKYGLYAEQFNGSTFTMPQKENLRTWFYRIMPSVTHKPFRKRKSSWMQSMLVNPETVTPNQLRWSPLPELNVPTTFLDGLKAFCISGSAEKRSGSAIHLYSVNASMQNEVFYNSDAEMLFIPQQGRVELLTECGRIDIEPLEIAVIPRGIKFQVLLPEGKATGYVCENYGFPFRLPDRGPIGSNGLANARDFLTPKAAYIDQVGDFQLVTKFNNQLWEAATANHPLDVVAWHGNYAPYKYDLRKYCVVNSVSFDHLDPSIFCVLVSPSGHTGIANCDFVIFPPRWLVAENTFRPPFFHRNIMSEYMGLIEGVYDAKEKVDGFVPGGGSLHNAFSAHGPEGDVFAKASTADLKPVKMQNTMAFLFESPQVYAPTDFALQTEILQKNYFECWQNVKRNFKK